VRGRVIFPPVRYWLGKLVALSVLFLLCYNILNTEEPRELIKKGNKGIGEGEVEVEELTIEGVKRAIRNLKNNKAVGTDGIHQELIKYGGDKLLNRMYELVRQISEEERIREEWKETIIVPIHKRGDRYV